MNYMDLLSIILPALACICVLCLILIKIFRKIRPNSFINVNCWFCNQWTNVPRHYYNSWNCPFCEQYNGFTKDGDYNKLIPAQHDELMNKVTSTFTVKRQIPDNGLCRTCNNNQQLKIHQLAKFSPIDEKNFDREINIYKEQLERAYKLCNKCDSVLKKTLRKQKSILLSLRLKTLRIKDLHNLKLNKTYQGIFQTAKRKFLTAIRYTTFIIACIRIFEILKTYNIATNFTNSLPSVLVPYVLLIKDLFLVVVTFLIKYAGYFRKNVLEIYILPLAAMLSPTYNNIKLIIPNIDFLYLFNINSSLTKTFIGLFLQSIFFIVNNRKLLDFFKFVTWILLTYIGTQQDYFVKNAQLNILTKVIEVALYWLLIIVPSSNYQPVKNKNKKSKLVPAKEMDEVSDDEFDYIKPTDLLNSTFTNENNEKLNISPSHSLNATTNNLFDMSNQKPDENLFHIFGQQPVFENPFNVSCFKSLPNYRSNVSSNESISTKKSCFNDSLNNYFCDSNISSSSHENKSIEHELNKCLNDLHLSSNKNCRTNSRKDEIPILRPKPILSPPRLQNVTQSSWVAGGYWKSKEFWNTPGSFSNLSRSSSQSSGFGSQASSQQAHNFDNTVFNSLPSSRTNSYCGEFDKYSVFSEPAYQYNKTSPDCYSTRRLYPNLRSGEQIYICPKSTMEGVYQRNNIRAPSVLNDSIWSTNSSNFQFHNRTSPETVYQNIYSLNNFPKYSTFRENNPFYCTADKQITNNTFRPLISNISSFSRTNIK